MAARLCWHLRAYYRMVTDTMRCPDCGGEWPEPAFEAVKRLVGVEDRKE